MASHVHQQNLLGAILVRSMNLPLNTLQAALDEQKVNERRLGEILIEMKAIDEVQLEAALQIQQQRIAALEEKERAMAEESAIARADTELAEQQAGERDAASDESAAASDDSGDSDNTDA